MIELSVSDNRWKSTQQHMNSMYQIRLHLLLVTRRDLQLQ